MSEDRITKPLQIKGKRIIPDDDYTLTSAQIEALLIKKLGSSNVVKDDKQYLIKKRKIALLAKNCTWINYDKSRDDYRIERRRVQLSDYFPDYVNKNYKKGFTTYYLGVYTYEAERDFLYVLFDTTLYAQKKSNNSGAQITIYDLLSAKTRGQFFKYDKSGNRIYILTEDKFIDFILNPDNSVLKIAEQEYQLLLYLKDFWNDIPLELRGDLCYQQMFDAAYSKAFECEWAGFYQEFMFEKFLKNNPTDLVETYGDKSKKGIDLDLKMPFVEYFYGDLKADNENFDIQGNKKETIDKIIASNGHIWYIVASFSDVVMDTIMNNYVLLEYNRLKAEYNANPMNKKKKKISMDYADKMKYSAKFKNFYVLDINSGNIDYLSNYKQGKNSNGDVRTDKYKISKKTIDEFKIFEFSKK